MSWPKELTTVTRTSKLLALLMFFLLPVIGFLLGRQYQSSKIEKTPFSYAPSTKLDTNITIPSPSSKVAEPVLVDDMNLPSKTLPGFTMRVLPEWSMTQKAFGDKNTNTFETLYFPNCNERCKGIRYSKHDVSFELIFDVAFDFNGVLCSNMVSVQPLQNGWYRIYDENRFMYSKSIDLNATHTEFPAITGSIQGGGWTTQPNGTYKVCLNGAGKFLKQRSLVETGDRNSGVPILLEHPRIQGNPDTATLSEIDTMISSIQGLEE